MDENLIEKAEEEYEKGVDAVLEKLTTEGLPKSAGVFEYKISTSRTLGVFEGLLAGYHAILETRGPSKGKCDRIRENFKDYGIESPSCDECYKMRFGEK